LTCPFAASIILESLKKCLKALGAKVAQEDILLTEEQLVKY